MFPDSQRLYVSHIVRGALLWCDGEQDLRFKSLLREAHMRYVGTLVSLLVVVAIVGLIYKYYLGTQQAAPIAHPKQMIDVIGVQNDLLGIAQAERMYQAEHGNYASLDELASSGAMNMKKAGRDGYTYESDEVSAESFRIVAHCPTDVPGCTNYAVDQTMEVQSVP